MKAKHDMIQRPVGVAPALLDPLCRCGYCAALSLGETTTMTCAAYLRAAYRLAIAACVLALVHVSPSMAAEAGAAEVAEAEQAARQVMDDFLRAFNDRDEAAWADTLQFPHVRLASGGVVVYENRAEFLDAMDLTGFAEQTGWDYSTWDDMTIVHAAPQKVHIAVTFTRYDE